MMRTGAIVRAVQGLHRGYKFAILLVAAWAPFLVPESPRTGALLMGSMTALFFLATGSRATPKGERVSQDG